VSGSRSTLQHRQLQPARPAWHSGSPTCAPGRWPEISKLVNQPVSQPVSQGVRMAPAALGHTAGSGRGSNGVEDYGCCSAASLPHAVLRDMFHTATCTQAAYRQAYVFLEVCCVAPCCVFWRAGVFVQAAWCVQQDGQAACRGPAEGGNHQQRRQPRTGCCTGRKQTGERDTRYRRCLQGCSCGHSLLGLLASVWPSHGTAGGD